MSCVHLIYISFLLAKCSDNSNRERLNDDTKIGFRIQTALEVLDDGYRWRKYGQKAVKNNKFPRFVFSSISFLIL